MCALEPDGALEVGCDPGAPCNGRLVPGADVVCDADDPANPGDFTADDGSYGCRVTGAGNEDRLVACGKAEWDTTPPTCVGFARDPVATPTAAPSGLVDCLSAPGGTFLAASAAGCTQALTELDRQSRDLAGPGMRALVSLEGGAAFCGIADLEDPTGLGGGPVAVWTVPVAKACPAALADAATTAPPLSCTARGPLGTAEAGTPAVVAAIASGCAIETAYGCEGDAGGASIPQCADLDRPGYPLVQSDTGQRFQDCDPLAQRTLLLEVEVGNPTTCENVAETLGWPVELRLGPEAAGGGSSPSRAARCADGSVVPDVNVEACP